MGQQLPLPPKGKTLSISPGSPHDVAACAVHSRVGDELGLLNVCPLPHSPSSARGLSCGLSDVCLDSGKEAVHETPNFSHDQVAEYIGGEAFSLLRELAYQSREHDCTYQYNGLPLVGPGIRIWYRAGPGC